MKQDILQTLKITAIALALTLGVNYVFAWVGPTSPAPDGNTPTPINVGTTNQIKDAGLGVNALSVFGGGYFQGNVGIGDTTPEQKLTVSGGDIGLDNSSVISWKNNAGIYQRGIWVDSANALSVGNAQNTTSISLSVTGSHALNIDSFGNVGIGAIGAEMSPGLKLDVEGKVGATQYCDQNGANCKTVSDMGGGGIGVGQTWQQLRNTDIGLTSRASGVNYTNSTAKPIMVTITFNANSGGKALVDGKVAFQMYVVNSPGFASFIVPPGSIYSFTASSGIRYWQELR